MKFNKLILGLAAFPLLLTSCNSAMTRDATLSWIKSHYKAETERKPALGLTEWNFLNVKGEKAYKIVNEQILTAIVQEEEIEGLSGLIPTNIQQNPSGHEYHITEDTKIRQLNESNFPEKFSTDPKDDVFKVKGDTLNVTYKTKYVYEKPSDDPKTWKSVTTTSVRNYNKHGYCTDYGCKVDGKWVDKGNSIKFKITLHFIYSDDPVD